RHRRPFGQHQGRTRTGFETDPPRRQDRPAQAHRRRPRPGVGGVAARVRPTLPPRNPPRPRPMALLPRRPRRAQPARLPPPDRTPRPGLPHATAPLPVPPARPPARSGDRVSQKTAMGLAGVFAAAYKIGELVGQLPLKVFRTLDDDAKVEAKTHRSWMILHD